MTTVNAETGNTNSTSVATGDSNPETQQTLQSVAQKLIGILELTTVSSSEQKSISLKSVVVKALSEGKQMSEIRTATNQAVQEITDANTAGNSQAKPAVAANEAENSEATASIGITANPAEVTLDPETGKMVATVLPGESIFRLAQRVYGKENGRKYLEIFAANRDKIKNINIVTEGQILTMP